MRRLVYASLAMVAVFCCLSKAAAAGPEAPRLEMRETSFDFKEAFEGENVSMILWSNHGQCGSQYQ